MAIIKNDWVRIKNLGKVNILTASKEEKAQLVKLGIYFQYYGIYSNYNQLNLVFKNRVYKNYNIPIDIVIEKVDKEVAIAHNDQVFAQVLIDFYKKSKINVAAKKSYRTRSFIKSEKWEPINYEKFNFAHSYLYLDTYNTFTKTGKFIDYSKAHKTFFQHCCSHTRTSADLSIFIPKFILNYYEYTLGDVKKWMLFIQNIVPFKYKIEELKNSYNNANNSYPEINDQFALIPAIKYVSRCGITIVKDSDYVVITIEGKPKTWITYLQFILVRFLFNTSYWNLPGLSMQIKDQLKDKVTHLEAVLLAHLNAPYSGYYSLTDNLYKDATIEGPIYNGISAESLINKLSADNSAMNSCFPKKYYNRKKIDKFFEEKNFEELLKYVNIDK